ncbi:MAG: hypothetical protein Q9224_006054, partial [Gallowayella concinna]
NEVGEDVPIHHPATYPEQPESGPQHLGVEAKGGYVGDVAPHMRLEQRARLLIHERIPGVGVEDYVLIFTGEVGV